MDEKLYCVVLIVPAYHPQLCGDAGQERESLTDAKEICDRLNLRYGKDDGEYHVMEYEAYLKHIPDCKDCAEVKALKERTKAICATF